MDDDRERAPDRSGQPPASPPDAAETTRSGQPPDPAETTRYEAPAEPADTTRYDAQPTPGTAPPTPDAIAASPPPPETAPTYWQYPKYDEPPWRARSVLGRTLDTLGAHFPRFLLLSLPAAVTTGVVWLFGVADIPAIVAVTIVGGTLASIAGVVMTALTDALWLGGDPSLGPLLRVTARRLLPLLGTYLIVVLGYALAIAAVAALLLAAPPIGVIATLVAFIPMVAVAIRLTPLIPIVVLDNVGGIPAIARSWELTRGHAWRLFRVAVLVSLVAIPITAGAQILSTYTDIPPVSALAGMLPGLLTASLGSIASTLAWAHMTGRPYADNRHVHTGKARRLAFGTLVGVGIVVAIVGITEGIRTGGPDFAAGGFAPQRGIILAGTGSNPVDPCRPTNPTTTFSVGEPVHIGGYFNERVLPGQSVDVEFYVDGTLALSQPLEGGPLGTECYYEQEPVTDLPPGEYRIAVRQAGTLVAEGRFTVR